MGRRAGVRGGLDQFFWQHLALASASQVMKPKETTILLFIYFIYFIYEVYLQGILLTRHKTWAAVWDCCLFPVVAYSYVRDVVQPDVPGRC